MKCLTAKYYAAVGARAGKFHSDVMLVKSEPMLSLSSTVAMGYSANNTKVPRVPTRYNVTNAYTINTAYDANSSSNAEAVNKTHCLNKIHGVNTTLNNHCMNSS